MLRVLRCRSLLPLLLLVLLALAGCGGSETTPLEPVDDNPFSPYAVGTDTTCEVLTWNLRNFATDAGATEVDLVAQAIAGLDADLVAVQEIAQPNRFSQLLDQLPGRSGYQATSDGFQNLGYVWLDSTVTVQQVYEIYTSEWNAFPRSPLVIELIWRGHPLVVIDNHLKCCGDGVLDPDDPDDEENRRLVACQLLEAWIAVEHPDQAVIVLGDLNDLLTDPAADNVFAPFFDRPDQYRFADRAIAEGPRSEWSWGAGQSHLDHILVTDELFAALAADGGACRTLRIDQALDGTYTTRISDHVPVALILPAGALP